MNHHVIGRLSKTEETNTISINYTVCSLIKFNAVVTSWLPDGTARLTTTCCKVFSIQIKYHSISTIKSTNIHYSICCWEPESDTCIMHTSFCVQNCSDSHYFLYKYLDTNISLVLHEVVPICNNCTT